MVAQTFEGSWEEIIRHAADLAGRRVRLTILEDSPRSIGSATAEQSLDKALAGFVGAIKSGTPHNDSKRAKEIWGEYVLEKHRKRQERRK